MSYKLFARVVCVPIFRLNAEVLKVSKSKVGKNSFSAEEDGADDVAVEEHLLNVALWPHWIDNARHRVVVNKHEGRVSKHLGEILNLVLQVKQRRWIASRLSNVID